MIEHFDKMPVTGKSGNSTYNWRITGFVEINTTEVTFHFTSIGGRELVDDDLMQVFTSALAELCQEREWFIKEPENKQFIVGIVEPETIH